MEDPLSCNEGTLFTPAAGDRSLGCGGMHPRQETFKNYIRPVRKEKGLLVRLIGTP